jgi:hypothetical protein
VTQLNHRFVETCQVWDFTQKLFLKEFLTTDERRKTQIFDKSSLKIALKSFSSVFICGELDLRNILSGKSIF